MGSRYADDGAKTASNSVALIGSIIAAKEGENGGLCGICCVSLDNLLDDFGELGVAFQVVTRCNSEVARNSYTFSFD